MGDHRLSGAVLTGWWCSIYIPNLYQYGQPVKRRGELVGPVLWCVYSSSAFGMSPARCVLHNVYKSVIQHRDEDSCDGDSYCLENDFTCYSYDWFVDCQDCYEIPSDYEYPDSIWEPWTLNDDQWTSSVGASTSLQSWEDSTSYDEHWECGGPSLRRAAFLHEKRIKTKKAENEACSWEGWPTNCTRRIGSHGSG